MNIIVNCRSKNRSAFIAASAEFLAQQLKINRSRWTLEIQTKRGLKRNEDMKGCVVRMGPSYVLMLLDSQLSFDDLLNTLSHEMVHVKQFVRKQMVIKETPKRSVYYWKGKRVVADYYNQPWEMEAWSKERLLATRLYAIIDKLL
jgi:hypothetical protein